MSPPLWSHLWIPSPKDYLFLLLFISNSSLFPLQELEMWNNFYLFCPSFLLDSFTALKLETHLSWSPLRLEHPAWGQAWHRCSSQLVEWIYEFWEKGSWGFPVGQRTLVTMGVKSSLLHPPHPSIKVLITSWLRKCTTTKAHRWKVCFHLAPSLLGTIPCTLPGYSGIVIIVVVWMVKENFSEPFIRGTSTNTDTPPLFFAIWQIVQVTWMQNLGCSIADVGPWDKGADGCSNASINQVYLASQK